MPVPVLEVLYPLVGAAAFLLCHEGSTLEESRYVGASELLEASLFTSLI